MCESLSVVSDSLWPHGLYSPWNSPGQHTGVGGLSLLQGIFPTQGSNLVSPALQADSLPSESQWNLEYDTDELLQNENRLTGTENRRAVAKGEGSAGGMDWEFGISRGKLKCVNNKVLLCSTGNYSQNPVINHKGKEYDKNVWMYV